MGKYLQDLWYGVHVGNKNTSFSDDQKQAFKSCSLIGSLFNLYLPKKIDVGDNIWRFVIYLTFDKALNFKCESVGLTQDCYVYCDITKLVLHSTEERKKILFDLFLKGLEECCRLRNYPFEEFRKIEAQILIDGIVFNNYYKTKKTSPDKKQSAQLKGFLSENYDDRKIFVAIFDQYGNETKSLFIGNFDFRTFDRLSWTDNKIIHVYHINNIQSFRGKKVADDYFIVDTVAETTKYNPTTKESIFEYGVKLLTETEDYDEALKLINKSKELGHGKAENILRNLAINPLQRNKAILLQTPKGR